MGRAMAALSGELLTLLLILTALKKTGIIRNTDAVNKDVKCGFDIKIIPVGGIFVTARVKWLGDKETNRQEVANGRLANIFVHGTAVGTL